VKALEDRWKEHSFDLVITVDNGIVANEAVSWLKSKGATVIVTDHHQPSETLPEADAIVHSSLLSGVGVAWALSRALTPDQADSHLDLVAIGTLADQVPLVGANRALVKHGLQALRHTQRASLIALAELAAIDLSKISANGITFTLAPRINAVGRLADPMDALRALVSQSPSRIKELIASMERTNTERQDLTQSMYKEVLQSLSAEVENLPPILIISGPYHEGIIGLLASKLVEQYHRPAIVISTLNDVWKASCRSVPGFSIIAALRSVEGVEFVSLGGHAMAAGFSLNATRGNESIERLKQELTEKYTNIALKSNSEYIGTLSFRLLIPDLVRVIEEFEPFGSGNIEPCFLLKDIRFTSVQYVGKQKQHWKGSLLHFETGSSAPAIFFRAQEKYLQDAATIDQVVVRVVASSYGKFGFDVQIAQAFSNEK
jgi:single-stranded-DNA-specific exonuclease